MRGFSLVELSIVLVILGLLTGGILAGQSLIRAAELRSVNTELTKYTTALYSFRDKYFALPGDMTTATKFWGKDSAACNSDPEAVGAPGTCNGNGDGYWNEAPNSAGVSGESFQGWKQLALAGMIEGTFTGLTTTGCCAAAPGTNVPRGRISNSGWGLRFITNSVYTTDGEAFQRIYSNHMQFGAARPGASPLGGIMTPEEAWNIDTKVDDGKPALGKVVGYSMACSTPNSGANVSSNFDQSYNLASRATSCSFLIIPF